MYQIVTLKWDIYEYLAIKDTQTEKIICTEQLEFVAYPECAFIEQVSENGRTYLETICKALNNEHWTDDRNKRHRVYFNGRAVSW